MVHLKKKLRILSIDLSSMYQYIAKYISAKNIKRLKILPQTKEAFITV